MYLSFQPPKTASFMCFAFSTAKDKSISLCRSSSPNHAVVATIEKSQMENQTNDSSSSRSIRRYAPPNQRKNINRGKSGDRGGSLHGNDVERNMTTPSIDSHRSRALPLAGCANSELSQFLNDRWQSTMHRLHNTIDPSEKPVLYSSSPGPAWGQFRLPHQMVSGPPTRQIDFLAELKRSMQNSGTDYN